MYDLHQIGLSRHHGLDRLVRGRSFVDHVSVLPALYTGGHSAHACSARWTGNFRDLNAAVVRMATLAQRGRISVEIVEEEIERLKATWAALEEQAESNELLSQVLSKRAIETIDLFDRVQLGHIIQVCRDSHSLSEAGRRLFDASRTRKTSTNDADRLRRYLSRFGLDWNQLVKS